MAPNSKFFAVVAGVGPGTGAAVARKFGLQYPVALLARDPANYEPYVKEINDAGGKAIGISTDVSDAGSVQGAFQKIATEFGAASCAAAIFNASGRFLRKSVLELTEDEFTAGYQVSWYGCMLSVHNVGVYCIDTMQQGCFPLLPSSPATSPEDGRRRERGISTHSHFYWSDSFGQKQRSHVLVFDRQIC